MMIKLEVISMQSQFRLKKSRQIESRLDVIEHKNWFSDNFCFCIRESTYFRDDEKKEKQNRFKLHLIIYNIVTELTEELSHQVLICRTSKISPEYLLKDTIFRRITKSVGCRFWLIHILNKIEKYNQNYQMYIDKVQKNIPIFTQLQVDAYRVLTYGNIFGYQLSNGSLGFSFRDNTKLILLPDFQQIYYIRQLGQISYFKDKASAPSWLRSKLAYVSVFENIARTYSETEADSAVYDVPFLVRWLRFVDCSVVYFSNGTLEILFHSGRKLILSPFMKPLCISESGMIGLVSQKDMQLILLVGKQLFQLWFTSSSFRWLIFAIPAHS